MNLVALPTGNIENWGESAMAGSPMTDTSTDPDTDERNQMVATILSSLLSWSFITLVVICLIFAKYSYSGFTVLEVSDVLKKNV